MTTVKRASAFPEALSSLRLWLNANAGTDPTLDDLAAACTARNAWSADRRRPNARQVLAVCWAIAELLFGDGRSDSERRVRRMKEFRDKHRALLEDYADIAADAAGQRPSYAAVALMHGDRRNRAAASALAFGPPQVFEELWSCSRKLDQYVEDACAVTGYVPRRGRPDQYALVAASQHLDAGGFTEEEIAQLLPDGSSSQAEHTKYRVRNRLRDEDRRTVVDWEQPE